jgi:hypothetical protein
MARVKPTIGWLPYRLPDRAYTKFTYSVVKSYDPAAGGVSSNRFRLSSIYDPDITGAGVSASPYTALDSYYDSYTVVAARYYVSWVDDGSAAAYTAYAYVYGGAASQPSTTPAVLAVDPAVQKYSVVPGTHNFQRKFGGKVRMADWCPRDPIVRGVAMNDNPALIDSVYLTMGVYPEDEASDLGAIEMKVQIVYTVLLHHKAATTVVN